MAWQANVTVVLAMAVAGMASLQAVGEEPRWTPERGIQAAPDLMPVKKKDAPKHESVELVRKGEPRAVVYVADAELSERLKCMVAELVESVKLTTGATLPVVTNPPAADQIAIVIGDCEETRKAGIDAAKIPIEGFEIKTAANRVYLVGSTMALPAGSTPWSIFLNDGTAWAVSDFLERFVGVRWFWGIEYGGRSVLKNSDLMVSPVNYSDAPVFRKRVYFPTDLGKAWYSTCNEKLYKLVDPNSEQPPVPAAWTNAPKLMNIKLAMFALRSGNSWPYLIKVHQPQGLILPQGGNEKMLAIVKKDAWYSRAKPGTRNHGIFCYSSQEAYDRLLSGAVDRWDKNQGSASWITQLYWSISPGDEPMECQCPECLKLYDPNSPQIGAASGHSSKILALFVKKACEEVKKRWPDKKVMYLPYWNYTLCPEDVDFPDNLELEVCTTATCRYNEKGIRSAIEKNLRAWSKKINGRKMTSWEYSGWGTLPTHAPIQYPHLIQDYYRKNRELLAGSFINGGDSPEWHKCAPTMYVWMRVMWNPEINVDATLDALCDRQFGKGAKTARALLKTMCDCWQGIESQYVMFPDWSKMADEIFNEAYPPEAVNAMEKLYRQAREEMKNEPEALARFDFWTYTFESFLKEARGPRAQETKKP